ncbi:hypothetical protein HG530_001693 [Fusarium avenaceum]|nr:hypothetical protein HG530_001693 [Fusarium avenaceum]
MSAHPDAGRSRRKLGPRKLNDNGELHAIAKTLKNAVGGRTSWPVEYHKDGNKNLAATLSLKTKSSEIAVHNVHNTNTLGEQINIDDLTGRFALSENHLVVGHFNLHHPAWAGKLMNPVLASPMANQLNERMAVSGMKLVTVKGTTTYRRKNAHRSSIASCIDLTFASTALKSKVLRWGVDDKSRWEKSDHCPIRTVLDFQPFLDTTVRYKYSKTALGAYQTMVAAKMEEMRTCTLSSQDDLDQAAVKLIQSLEECRDKCIPSCLANPPGKSRYPQDPNIRLTMQKEAITVAEPGPGLDREVRRVMRRRAHEANKLKGGDGYRRYAGMKSTAPNGVWALSKMAKRMVAPQHTTDMPPLTKEQGDVTYVTEEEKQKCLRDSIWSRTSDTPGAYKIQFPDLDPNRRQLNIDQSLDEATVDRFIRKLPSGKAAGRDKIASEAIKMARTQLLEFITRFFGACLQFCHIPRIFRQANTVILPKADKETYDSPKSWRPIALLRRLHPMR